MAESKEVNLRFKSTNRTTRMLQALFTVVTAVPVSLIAVAGWVVFFVTIYTIKGVAEGLVTIGWYAYHSITENWKL